jgi:DNA-binding MarR family transcriptional regulator
MNSTKGAGLNLHLSASLEAYFMDDQEQIQSELAAYMRTNDRNWARLMWAGKRLFERSIQQAMNASGIGPFKFSYIPFLASISLKSITNRELAQRAKVPKQAMSRTVKELEEQGLIRTEKNQKDGRSVKISLTIEGQKHLLTIKREQHRLMDEYKRVVGEEHFNIAVDVLRQIIAYHESLDQETDDE